MDVERKTGRMAGRQSDTNRTRNGEVRITFIEAFIFKAPSDVPIQRSSGVRFVSDRPKGVPPREGGARAAGMRQPRLEAQGHMIEGCNSVGVKLGIRDSVL